MEAKELFTWKLTSLLHYRENFRNFRGVLIRNCSFEISLEVYNVYKADISWNFTGAAAKEVFKDASQDLMVVCQHVRSTFDKAVVDFRMSKSVNGMDIDSNN